MKFETHNPASPINKYIESIFHYKDFVPEHSIERVVPTGHIFIIFELDDITRNTFNNETLEPNRSFTKVWISGIHKHYISISAHENSEMFVIQFKPYGAYPFFHFPMKDLTEKILPGQEVLGDELLDVRSRVYKQSSSRDKFEVAEQWLTKRFDPTETPPEELLEIIEELQEKSATEYPEITDSYPHTQKHLIDQFKKYVGLTPKYFQRILRFNEILEKIRNNENIAWSEVAYQCQFSDQSHFIKEFKHFSGFNPEEFIKEEYNQDEPNFFPLDREG